MLRHHLRLTCVCQGPGGFSCAALLKLARGLHGKNICFVNGTTRTQPYVDVRYELFQKDQVKFLTPPVSANIIENSATRLQCPDESVLFVCFRAVGREEGK